MKNPISTLRVLSLLICAALPGSVLAQDASPSKLSVTVKRVDTTPKTKKDPKEKKGDNAKAETEKTKLVITLRNVSAAPATGAEVKYYFLSRISGDGAPATAVGKEGSKTVTVEPNSTAEVESEEFSTTFTDAHTPKKGKRERAHGEKIVGWGVKVMVGGGLSGEAYSSDSARKLINEPAEKN